MDVAESPSDDVTVQNAREALDAVRATTRAEVCDGGGYELLSMRVLAYCSRARRAEIPPEQMLVSLKQALDGPLSRADGSATKRDGTRARIIELAINAYYSHGC
jgi:hypothetical protein